jgi:hypothetical protein
MEQGDIFFFYRPRVETRRVGTRANVQRFFMVLAAERGGGTRFRVFAIGRKQLPDVRPGQSHPEERNWAVNVLATTDPEAVRREFLARQYPTATRGMRLVGAAKPVGEGRYQLVSHLGHTELAYALELPRSLGPAQEEFQIKKTASYIVAVKNPDVVVQGFTSPADGPRYPQHVRDKFGDRRWIEVDDPGILDYEGAEILLLGAHTHDVEDELGIEIDEEVETRDSAEIFRKLRLGKEARAEPLFRGEFPGEELPGSGEEVVRRGGRRPSTPAAATRPSRRSRRRLRCETCNETFDQPSRYARHLATSHPRPAPSAADVERALAGIDFPRTRPQLVAYASKRLAPDSETLRLIRTLPDRRYRDAAEIAIALGEVKGGKRRRPAS